MRTCPSSSTSWTAGSSACSTWSSSRGAGGAVSLIELGDLDGDGTLDLAVFEGVSSGILGSDDLDAAGGVLEPGASAAVAVYENLWAAPLAGALRRSGGRLVAGGLIPHGRIVAESGR